MDANAGVESSISFKNGVGIFEYVMEMKVIVGTDCRKSHGGQVEITEVFTAMHRNYNDYCRCRKPHHKKKEEEEKGKKSSKEKKCYINK